MKENLKILRRIAKEVYQTVNPILGKPEAGRIVGAGYGGDETRFIDEVAEQAIIDHLERNNISCIFIGEERGVKRIGANPAFYIISDAVDGSTNAVRGIEFVSLSLAISPKDSLEGIETAIVMNLYNGRIYEAEKGKGARCEGKTIKTSEKSSLEESVLCVDVSRAVSSAQKAIPLIRLAKGIRSFGSASLEICMVASGQIDAYVDLRGKLRTLDFAAAMLIIREAGGIFNLLEEEDFSSIPLTKIRHFSLIAAANSILYQEITNLISEKS
ncbi:MAG: D-fructose 1,6-bisphosphatase [Candidatus Bathyarchaeota archaeon]|nr:D-fructose 1,6-bisphosphatase [Candidatus Bathyarchaeota archaeon]